MWLRGTRTSSHRPSSSRIRNGRYRAVGVEPFFRNVLSAIPISLNGGSTAWEASMSSPRIQNGGPGQFCIQKRRDHFWTESCLSACASIVCRVEKVFAPMARNRSRPHRSGDMGRAQGSARMSMLSWRCTRYATLHGHSAGMIWSPMPRQGHARDQRARCLMNALFHDSPSTDWKITHLPAYAAAVSRVHRALVVRHFALDAEIGRAPVPRCARQVVGVSGGQSGAAANSFSCSSS